MAQFFPIQTAMNSCRSLLVVALAMSFIINILLLAVPLYSMRIFGGVLRNGAIDSLLQLIVVTLICLTVASLFQFARSCVLTQASCCLDDALASNVLNFDLHKQTIEPIEGVDPLADLALIRAYLTSYSLTALFDAPWLILYFAAISYVDWRLGLIAISGSLLLLLLLGVAHALLQRSSALSYDLRKRAAIMFDSLVRDVETGRAMGIWQRGQAFWRQYHRQLVDVDSRSDRRNGILSVLVHHFRLGLQILLLGYGAVLVLHQELTMSGMIAAAILSAKALEPFDGMVGLHKKTMSAVSAYKRLRCNRWMTQPAKQGRRLPQPQGNVTFDSVYYDEPIRGVPIVRRLDLSVAAGQMIGVIGASGSGKSSLARLLAGIHLPSAGVIKVDGIDRMLWNPSQLADATGYLPQRVDLMATSVAMNIARFDRFAKVDEVIAAAKLAEAHEFILDLPQGYHTKLLSEDVRLSCGQIKRLALARCFFRFPKLIILDEPEHGLDPLGMEALVRGIKKARAYRATGFIISHHLPLLRFVDKVLLLRNGRGILFEAPHDIVSSMNQMQRLKTAQAIVSGLRSL